MLVCIFAWDANAILLTLSTVVRTPEDAAHSSKQPFDYVLLCVKALPDVYDIANIIESVVSPQHTCILMNTTHSIGVESYLEQRFPTNVVLSLVSGAEIVQLGASEFEHKGATDIWVGPANRNAAIPAQIQSDMAEALAMTLSSGQVDCKVSPNIRQQQYERMIGYVDLVLNLLLSLSNTLQANFFPSRQHPFRNTQSRRTSRKGRRSRSHNRRSR
jgi:ketopantoate reductase